MNDLPLVSIICTAYNHETYIKDALEGFVIQKTSFPIEIIVHDDASSDNTANIIRAYEAKYPELFTNIYQTENQYSKGKGDVARIIFSAARGKYIALCEGDDYWVDPYKLQKQFDFLESNPEYGMVHTNLDVYYEETNSFKRSFHSENDVKLRGSIFETLLVDNPIATVTVMFRREYLNHINLDNLSRFKMGDLFIWLEIAKHSKIGYIDDVTSVYRIHFNSLSQHNGGLKRMEFLISSFHLKYYFIGEYGCSRDTEETVYRKALNTWYSLKEQTLFNKSYQQLKNIDRTKLKDVLQYKLIKISFLYNLDLLIKRIWKFIKRKSESISE
jgi:glycosyltransferase involved in cell wall biosynthesis